MWSRRVVDGCGVDGDDDDTSGCSEVDDGVLLDGGEISPR